MIASIHYFITALPVGGLTAILIIIAPVATPHVRLVKVYMYVLIYSV